MVLSHVTPNYEPKKCDRFAYRPVTTGVVSESGVSPFWLTVITSRDPHVGLISLEDMSASCIRKFVAADCHHLRQMLRRVMLLRIGSHPLLRWRPLVILRLAR